MKFTKSYTLNKLYKKINFILYQFKVYGYYIFKYYYKTNKKKVIIFGQGRTGSTLLEDLISSSKNFDSYGEILGHNRSKSIIYPYQYISGLSNIKSIKHFVFHLKIYHLIRDREDYIDPKSFLKKLADDGWKIIYLNRKNKLEHVLSNILVNERKSYHKKDDKIEYFKITLDIDQVREGIKTRLEYDEIERDVLNGLNHLEIIYERDLLNGETHQKTVDSVNEFIGLSSSSIAHTSLRKINKQKVKDLVANYDELYLLLEKESWIHYLQN